MNDTLKFSSMLSSIPPLEDDKEDVSRVFESLFTNIPIEETINYITEQVYVHEKLTPTCSKLIFRGLSINLLQNVLLNTIADSLKKWMVAIWEDHYLLLLVI